MYGIGECGRIAIRVAERLHALDERMLLFGTYEIAMAIHIYDKECQIPVIRYLLSGAERKLQRLTWRYARVGMRTFARGVAIKLNGRRGGMNIDRQTCQCLYS